MRLTWCFKQTYINNFSTYYIIFSKDKFFDVTYLINGYGEDE